ncbi:MAG: hypothetical protein ACD_19C00057G0003 [uncultured bacterium]|nr:MAG: hypothetical protein ACD_19C00057G0003 [uncultured bacterium]
MASAVSSGQIKQNQSLFRSLLDSGSFLPILGTALGVAGAGALADTISNMEGLTFNDLFQSGKAAIGLHTPSGLQAIARKTIQNAGNKIKDTGNKIRGKQSTAELLGLDKSKDFATGGKISPEFGGGEKQKPELQPTPEPSSEEELEENQDEATPEEEPEENDEETPKKEPYQPFSKPEEENEEKEDGKKKKEGEEPEKEKTPKELDQERAVAFQKGKNAQTNEAQKGKKGKDAKTEKEEKDKKEKEEPGIQEMSSYIMWFIFRDILNVFLLIIPIIGPIISGTLIIPFVGLTFFMIFKQDKKHKLALTKEIATKWELYGIIYIFSMALAVYMIDKKLKINASTTGKTPSKKTK